MRAAPPIIACLLLAFAAVNSAAAPRTFVANDYGAKGDGTTLNTAAIQKAIDAAAAAGGTVTLNPATYLTGRSSSNPA